MRRPSNQIPPESAFMTPVTRLNSVVFPEPLGPISAVIVPSRTWRSAPSTARTPPNAFDTFLTSSSTGASRSGSSALGGRVRATPPALAGRQRAGRREQDDEDAHPPEEEHPRLAAPAVHGRGLARE